MLGLSTGFYMTFLNAFMFIISPHGPSCNPASLSPIQLFLLQNSCNQILNKSPSSTLQPRVGSQAFDAVG